MADFVGGLTVDEYRKEFGTASAVKSVQSGVTQVGSNHIDVTINEVDLNKTLCFVSRPIKNYSDATYECVLGYSYVSTCRLISSTQLRVCATNNSGGYVYWQVIEYY